MFLELFVHRWFLVWFSTGFSTIVFNKKFPIKICFLRQKNGKELEFLVLFVWCFVRQKMARPPTVHCVAMLSEHEFLVFESHVRYPLWLVSWKCNVYDWWNMSKKSSWNTECLLIGIWQVLSPFFWHFFGNFFFRNNYIVGITKQNDGNLADKFVRIWRSILW